jgi:hypothetical protein
MLNVSGSVYRRGSLFAAPNSSRKLRVPLIDSGFKAAALAMPDDENGPRSVLRGPFLPGSPGKVLVEQNAAKATDEIRVTGATDGVSSTSAAGHRCKNRSEGTTAAAETSFRTSNHAVTVACAPAVNR